MGNYDYLSWLGRWEDIPAPGRHSGRVPADGATGYPAPYHGQVLRAIQASGTVTDGPTWENSPQVKFWLDEEPVSLWERIKAWMRRPA